MSMTKRYSGFESAVLNVLYPTNLFLQSEHLNRRAQPLLHHDSQETEVMEESILQPESHSSEAEEMETWTLLGLRLKLSSWQVKDLRQPNEKYALPSNVV
ncbi:hypothetical protein AALO_G00209240 [Alosa alosa]|uniref:Uncharacterized protein n=1 Tax=Alosa alosa TaxID=278164 RepID=A0AAV6FZC0_9TELE|nr:hypothetical protein AALO_G00209240 [Alosa alosa]